MKRNASAEVELEDIRHVKRESNHTITSAPSTLERPISPPVLARQNGFKPSPKWAVVGAGEALVEEQLSSKSAKILQSSKSEPKLAAVEAGEATVEDHFSFFSSKLLEYSRPNGSDTPRISHHAWCELYQRNLHPHGRHFVIHQHDHPVAGTHYDLRVQCNGTSSISFAIMYGLPGDPNSRRFRRNAAETRVHNLWNHLIESASHSTGSMLIWDTGEYSVLPSRRANGRKSSSSEDLDESDGTDLEDVPTESQKLHDAFRQGIIRLRLHGTRLPHNYTISLRLSNDDFPITEQPGRPKRRRKILSPKIIRRNTQQTSSSESGDDASSSSTDPLVLLKKENLISFRRTASPPLKIQKQAIPTQSTPEVPKVFGISRNDSSREVDPLPGGPDGAENTTATHHSEDESETIRLTNAYPGATNTISSIHQRRWFLSLDRHNSGFVPQRDKVTGQKIWLRRSNSEGFEKFYVLGREVEKSVVTGRLAAEILEDEGVEGFVPRGGWRAVVE